MTDDIDVGARVAAVLSDVAPSAELGTRILEQVETRRARRRALQAGVAVAAAVTVIAAVLVNRSSGVRDGSVVTDSSGATFHWEALPPAPVPPRSDSSAVWTGTEVVVWGGAAGSSSRAGLRADGAAYNPTTGSWRTLPPAPVGPRGGHVAVWTGTEMIVWGGWRPESPVDEAAGWSDGAAYSPATDSWRPVPEAPIDTRIGVGAAWTGSEMVILGGTSAGGPGRHVIGAAYDPSGNSWRLLPDLPVQGTTSGWAAWTGREVLYWRPAGGLVLNGRSRTEPQLFAYHPEVNSWRQAARPPDAFALQWSGATIGWAGSELVVVSTSGLTASTLHARAVAYNPTTDAWRPVATSKANVFIPNSRALWTGRELVTLDSFGYVVSALRPRSGEWATLPEAPRGLFDASIVATDAGDVYVFGETHSARLARRPSSPSAGD